MTLEKNEILNAKLKCEIKEELIYYYDSIRFEIDIQVQELILADKINDSHDEKSIDQEESDKKLISNNNYLIQQLDCSLNSNLKEINDYFDLNENKVYSNKEQIKKDVLTSYCAYISNSKLNDNYSHLYPIGLLIETDWYLDENQFNFLKYSLT